MHLGDHSVGIAIIERLRPPRKRLDCLFSVVTQVEILALSVVIPLDSTPLNFVSDEQKFSSGNKIARRKPKRSGYLQETWRSKSL
jgi:hypothetical protein